MRSLSQDSNDGDSVLARASTAALPFDDASWRNGALSDWTVYVGCGREARQFRVHSYALGLGERASGYFYNHFAQPAHLHREPRTTRLEIGRAFLCQCGSATGSCRCPKAVRKRVAELDRIMMLAFEELLEYFYEGTLEPAEHALLPLWALADYLQIASLSSRVAALFEAIVSRDNAHRLLADSLRLRFGAALVVPRCLDIIARSFASYEFEQLSCLGADMLTRVLTHPALDASSAAVGAFIGRFVRQQRDAMPPPQFIQFVAFLDDDKYEILADDALYLVRQIGSVLAGKHADKMKAAAPMLEALQTRCFDSIAAGVDALDADEFAQLPLDVVIGILGRDNLAVGDEDDVFRLIRAVVAAQPTPLSPRRRRELWATCRFAFLSAPTMLEASQTPDIPSDLVMQGAIMFKMLQSSSPPTAEAGSRPRLTPAFDERVSGASLQLSNKSRTVRLSGPVGHNTAFSRHVVRIDASATKTFYWEVRLEGVRNVQGLYIGLAAAPSKTASSQAHLGSSSSLSSWAMQASTGKKFHSGRSATYGVAVARGDVVGMALRCRNGVGSLTFYKNGASMGEAYARVQGAVVPAVTMYRKDQQVTLTYKPSGAPSAAAPLVDPLPKIGSRKIRTKNIL